MLLWAPLAMSLAFLGSGGFVLLFYLAVIFKDVPGERHWSLPLLGGIAVLIGILFLAFAIVEALSRRLSPGALHQIRFMLSYGLALAVLTTLAAGLTWAAFVAWQGEPAAASSFSGGITGSIYEHRIVWTLAALVIDLLALVAWLVGILGAVGGRKG